MPLRGATFPVLRYAEGDALRLPLAAPASAPLRGVNVAADAEAGELAGLRARGATWIRLVVGRSGWADETAAFAAVRRQLAACRDLGLTVLIDPHDFIFQVAAWTDPMPEDERAVADFTRLWDGLARIGAEFPGTVAGYDLYNELLVRHDWDGWSRMATRAIAAIRRHDASARIYMTGLVMANPEGFAQARPLARDDVSYSFHFYRPHGFTHQKMHARQVQDPYVFYPGWIPEMDWKGKTHIGRTAFAYWDRWALGEAMLPVLAFAARNRVAVHCGEFGVIGYCKDQAMASAARWTGDSIAWFERQGMPWHLWNKGYGLCVPDVVPVVEAGWARGR